MANIEDTGHQLAELIKKYDADYIEARLVLKIPGTSWLS